MNKFEELVTYQDLRNIWMDCPWGVAVIGIDGIVRAVNPTVPSIRERSLGCRVSVCLIYLYT